MYFPRYQIPIFRGYAHCANTEGTASKQFPRATDQHPTGKERLPNFTPLRVCRNQRIHIHKVFRGIAQRGKCSMGWFFDFKLHLICNEKGELLNFMITPGDGDVDDRKPLEYKAFIEFIYGKLVADKGYISKNLFQRLFVDGIQLITKLKNSNITNPNLIWPVCAKLLLQKISVLPFLPFLIFLLCCSADAADS